MRIVILAALVETLAISDKKSEPKGKMTSHDKGILPVQILDGLWGDFVLVAELDVGQDLLLLHLLNLFLIGKHIEKWATNFGQALHLIEARLV